MKKIVLIGLFCLSFIGQFAFAQSEMDLTKQPLTLNQFLQLVSQNNLEYAAEKFNIPISEAAVERARIFPDPSISFDWLENREGGSRTGFGYISEVGTTIELGGKRKARINLAESEQKLTQALLDDYFRNLRADAAIVYLEAVKQNQLYEVKFDSYQTMKKLSEADSIRVSLGSIMKTNAIQSKLEAGILLNELIQAEAERLNSLSQLNLIAGISKMDTILFPEMEITENPRLFVLKQLIETAEQNRADIEAARYNREVSANTTNLIRKERKMDLNVRLGLENDLYIPNNVPGAKIINTGIGIPLKFSNMNRGDLEMARYYEQQVDKQYAFVLLKIKTEITEAYHSYISTKNQVENFKNNLLKQSE
ncbi:TolC family protein, partial [Draconibacterium sp.]|nr:TolC family protein [Draconibacterium sp.]